MAEQHALLHRLLPRWLLVTLLLAPLLVFLLTMTVAIRIVQRRGNTILWEGEEYHLHTNIFRNDISAYGIDTPEHYVFATGFTLLSLSLCCVMILRYLLFRSLQDPNGSCCYSCWNGLVLMVGLLHFPAILLMAWSNGRGKDQNPHFLAAVIGMGLLHLYALCNLGLIARQLVVKRRCDWISEGLVGVTVVLLFPFCIYRWITAYEAVYEWLAVLLLFSSMLPSVVHVVKMPTSTTDSAATAERRLVDADELVDA